MKVKNSVEKFKCSIQLNVKYLLKTTKKVNVKIKLNIEF